MIDEKFPPLKGDGAKKGRKAHEPTSEQLAEVQALAGFGVREDEIARYLGIDPKTLRKYYREQLDTAHIRANVQVARALFTQATEGNTAAAIFWLKSRANWSEKVQIESTGEGINLVINRPHGA